MSDTRISQLPGATTLTGAEIVPITQNSTTVQTTTQAIANLTPTTPTSSLLVTASVNSNVITFTKGDASQFNLTVNTGSAGGAAFPYTGSAAITGSLAVNSILVAPQITSNDAIYPGGPNTLSVRKWNNVNNIFPFYYQTLFPSIQPYFSSEYTNTDGTNTIVVSQGHLGIGTRYDDLNNNDRKLESIYLYVSQSTQANAGTFTAATSVTRTIISDSNTITTAFGFTPTVDSLINISTANSRTHVLTVTGSMLARDGVSLGTNISNQHYITGSVRMTGSLSLTGSATISDVLVLPFQSPLPSGKPTGSVAISGSGGTFVGMYVYNGTSWTNVKA